MAPEVLYQIFMGEIVLVWQQASVRLKKTGEAYALPQSHQTQVVIQGDPDRARFCCVRCGDEDRSGGKEDMKKMDISRTIDQLTMRAVALETIARQADDPTARLYAVKLAYHLDQAGREATALEGRLAGRPKRGGALCPVF
jgi:hypothetical protein